MLLHALSWVGTVVFAGFGFICLAAGLNLLAELVEERCGAPRPPHARSSTMFGGFGHFARSRNLRVLAAGKGLFFSQTVGCSPVDLSHSKEHGFVGGEGNRKGYRRSRRSGI